MAVADSGAMSNLWSLKGFLDSGFQRKDLKQVAIDIRAANKNPLNILGYFDCKISGSCVNNRNVSCLSRIYVSDNVNDFYMSYDTMLDLGIVNRAFLV